MKKQILIMLLMCLCSTLLLSSEVVTKKTDQSWSPVKFCLWPGVWSIPSDSNIYGANFGFANFGRKDRKVVGADMALFCSQTDNVKGLQMALTNVSSNGSGAELGLGFDIANNFSGMQMALITRAIESKSFFQLGFGNDAIKSNSFFQLGLYNKADKDSDGFQVGLINVMDKGYLPVTLFVNF